MDDQHVVPYETRVATLPAFTVVGYTETVESGGEQYEAVRHDCRWGLLRKAATVDGTIYGVASLDSGCPEGKYRYTVGVKSGDDPSALAVLGADRFDIRIPASQWVIFTLTDFGAQYGQFWTYGPYRMVTELGWSFNGVVGLHIDAYGPAYVSDHDPMEFLMPVVPPE